MHQRTHEKIALHLCGRPVELGAGRARLTMEATAEMAADSRGLVHGGFTFGRSDGRKRRVTVLEGEFLAIVPATSKEPRR
jgi:hypothetical protein